MVDLDNLRREVLEAINRTDMTIEMFDTLVTVNRDDYDLIRTELLRLAVENATVRGALETLDVEGHKRAEKAEAELAALRARIEAAPLTTFRRAMLGTPHAWVEEKFACPEWIGKRVRLVVEE